MAKTSPDACLRCDAGEQTCIIIYRPTEHDFAIRATVASMYKIILAIGNDFN